MTDGMKSGAGSDPFADDDDDTSETDETGTVSQETGPTDKRTSTATGENDESGTRSDAPSSDTGSDLPYIFARNGVKDDRKMIQYFLRDETQQLETEIKRAVEEELETDVYLTDIREAIVRVSANHVDEITDELRDWGYNHKEK